VLPGGDTWDTFLRTIIYVFVAVVLSLAIGYPVAWYAARHAGRWRGLILVLLVLPFWISYLMRMFAWTNLLAENGYAARALNSLSIDTLFQKLGLLDGSDWLGGQHIAVILALVYGYVPYLILPLFAALDRIDQRYIEAARDLGASPAGAFWRVVVPLSKTGTIAGIVLIALPMFGDYYTPDLISGSPKTAILGNAINGYVQGGPDKSLGAALTILLSAFLLVFMLYYLRVVRADQRAAAGVA
jgi:spermidine/putrescine transport system permease protein